MNSLNILESNFNQTGKSRETDENGMLEMQARAYKQRDAQYLLLKSPPASGKSRALMFLGLDKLRKQGLKKVIVAVPEMSIGSSFKSTKLTDNGFFADWQVEPKYNLCIAGGDAGKVDAFVRFMSDPNAEVLICTHATLRFAYQRLTPADFDGVLLGVDEFHHSSASDDNILGGLIDAIIEGSSAHIVAMTGSYFRGDAVPVMSAEYEAKFTQVTYSYYEQLNGYQYLKSLGMNYHFYKGTYLSALDEVLDTTKKTIIHIPNVNSLESTKDKYSELDSILSVIGTPESVDDATGILTVKTDDGRLLKVADLVTDNKTRALTQAYLADLKSIDDLDIIIALGMAKEGFDWVWCEHVLTIGYRSSLTEVIQIIGRATRDSDNKTHAQFTNLISQPEAEQEDVKKSVNNLLKAITVSLLMKQVLTPNINFKPRSRMTDAELYDGNSIAIDDSSSPMSDKAVQALNNIDNIKAALMLKEKEVVAPVMTGQCDVNTFVEYELPKIIASLHPELDEDELDVIARAVHASLVLQASGGIVDEENLPKDAEFWDTDNNATDSDTNQASTDSTSQPTPSVEFVDEEQGDGNAGESDDESADSGSADSLSKKINRKFALIDSKFIDVEKIGLSLIQDKIECANPFEGSYTVLSKLITPDALNVIETHISQTRSTMSDDEATQLFPRVKEFTKEHGRPPQLSQTDHFENRLALALALIKERLRRRKSEQLASQDS